MMVIRAKHRSNPHGVPACPVPALPPYRGRGRSGTAHRHTDGPSRAQYQSLYPKTFTI